MAISTLLALTNPRLLRSLVLLDPVLQPSLSGIEPAVASTHRRDLWESRDAAAAKFKQSKFYQAWDPRVLDLWVQHGLRRVPTALHPAQGPPAADQRVTLTTTKHQELFTFLRPSYRGDVGGLPDRDAAHLAAQKSPYAFYRPEPLWAFRRLPELRPSVLYVFGEASDMSSPAARKTKMELTGTGLGGSGGATKGRVKEVVLDCGHLVAMERVQQCADAAVAFLGAELALWRAEQKEFEARRAAVDKTALAMIDDRWKQEIKPKI